MKRLSKKLLVILIIIILAGGWFYQSKIKPIMVYMDSWTPAWGWKCIYNFCTYELPKQYEFIEYSYSKKDDSKGELIFENKNTDQFLMLTKLREYPNIDLKKVNFSSRKVDLKYQLKSYSRIFSHFNTLYILPFLCDDSLKNLPDDLTIRGFNPNRKEKLSTQTTDILYMKGRIKDVGLYRPDKWYHRYPALVFQFDKVYDGAIAIITDKKTKKTIFAFSMVPDGNAFNEDDFKLVLNTLTFDTKPYYPDPKFLKLLKTTPQVEFSPKGKK